MHLNVNSIIVFLNPGYWIGLSVYSDHEDYIFTKCTVCGWRSTH